MYVFGNGFSHSALINYCDICMKLGEKVYIDTGLINMYMCIVSDQLVLSCCQLCNDFITSKLSLFKIGNNSVMNFNIHSISTSFPNMWFNEFIFLNKCRQMASIWLWLRYGYGFDMAMASPFAICHLPFAICH
jgi:hypothetical protein